MDPTVPTWANKSAEEVRDDIASLLHRNGFAVSTRGPGTNDRFWFDELQQVSNINYSRMLEPQQPSERIAAHQRAVNILGPKRGRWK